MAVGATSHDKETDYLQVVEFEHDPQVQQDGIE